MHWGLATYGFSAKLLQPRTITQAIPATGELNAAKAASI
jgi:hypothetical protein